MADLPPLPGRLRALSVTARMAMRCEPGMAALAFVLLVTGWLGTPVWAWGIGAMTDAAAAGRARDALPAAIVVGVWVGYHRVAGMVGQRVRRRFSERAGIRSFDRPLVAMEAGIPGIEHHQRTAIVDRLQLLREESWIVTGMLEAAMHTAGVWIEFAVVAVLLARLHTVLLVLPLLAAPSLVTSAYAVRRNNAARERTAADYRLSR